MNYDMRNDTCGLPRGEEKRVDLPIANMTDMMREVSAMTDDALSLSRKINGHLFGIGKPICEKETDPRCFRDELEKTRSELLQTIEELHNICSMLGM